MSINRLNSKKKIWTFSIIIVILLLGFGVTYAMEGNNLAKLFGQQQAEILSNAGDSIVATVNGEKITKKGFDTYKLFVNSGDNKLSDAQVLDTIIERSLVYNEATKEGLSATDEEVTNLIKSSQDIMKANDEQYSAFKDYLSGLNMTEEQYWDSVKPAYKKFITCGKLKNNLKQKYAQENNIKDKTELANKFKDYYNQYVKDLKDKAKIEIDLK